MSGRTDNLTWGWSCNYSDHEHQSWEEANCGDILTPLVAQLQCGSGDAALSYGLSAITSDYMATTLMVNPDETCRRIYAQLKELYESAGQPEGSDDAGLSYQMDMGIALQHPRQYEQAIAECSAL